MGKGALLNEERIESLGNVNTRSFFFKSTWVSFTSTQRSHRCSMLELLTSSVETGRVVAKDRVLNDGWQSTVIFEVCKQCQGFHPSLTRPFAGRRLLHGSSAALCRQRFRRERRNSLRSLSPVHRRRRRRRCAGAIARVVPLLRGGAAARGGRGRTACPACSAHF